MKNRVVQILLSVAMLGLMIQIVLVAPSQIRDAETKAALLPNGESPLNSEDDPSNISDPDERRKALLEASKEKGLVDQSMKGMRMIETQEGRKEWELWADRAARVKAQLKLENVKVLFFSDSGVTFTVTGDRGLVQEKTKNLHIEGNVITRSSNGYVFKTESMDYASQTRQLTTVNIVEMTGPRDGKGQRMRLTGVGMKASLANSTMEVLSDVKAEKGLENGRRAFIKSHRSFFSGRDRTAKFFGDVILDLDSMRITGPEAEFAYDSKKDMIRTAHFSGGARVSDAQKWATAQNVNVDFESNRFVFRGNPRVVQDNDELRGQEIVFIDGGKKVQVQGARAEMDPNTSAPQPRKARP